MRPRLGALSGVLLAIGLLACSPPADPDTDVRVPVDGGGQYTDITPGRLAGMLEDKDFSMVNVHVPYEGEIDGTDLFIAFDQIGERLDELPPPEAKIVLYCRSGSMSAIAARELVAAGYTDVWNLDGGMNAWRAHGYPLEERPPG